MPNIELAPYFHPSQVILIDDDIDFLGNLSLQLDADLAYLLFDSTEKALSYLNGRQNSAFNRDRFFRECDETPRVDNVGDKREFLEIDRAALQREMHSTDRFSEISVALVDYAMPEMNGLEFCRQIADPNIKKVLFTGVATESVAVQAFNDGVIDQYIRKHEYAVYERLNQTVRRFQTEYIKHIFEAAAGVLPLRMPACLTDEAIARLIEQLRKTHGLVEYYMSSDASGFWFANADGHVRRLVVISPGDSRTAAQQLAELEAPDTLIRAVEQGRVYMPNKGLDQLRRYGFDSWRDVVADTSEVPMSETALRWTILEPDTEHDMSRVKPSYNEFLEWLDTVGYALM